MTDTPPCQLYLISPLEVGGDFPAQLETALEGGPVAAFQFRVKDVARDEAVRLAVPLKQICDDHDVAFVVNDDLELASRTGADGLHIGQQDVSLQSAREQLGADIQIGVTCHDSRHLAMEAGEGGANYVAFGAFFPTETKQTFYRPEPEILTWWSTFTELPCVAIGGINAENCRPLVKAGADFLAVSGAVWNHPKGPRVAVEKLLEAIETSVSD